jgi:hypothetical protein
MINVHPLFFSPIYQIFIPDGLPAFNALKKYEYVSTGAEGSYNCYMTKNYSVLDDFPKEKQIILNYFYTVKNEFLRHEDTDFTITSSWATRVEHGSVSQYHTHANNFYTGVFYFDEYGDDTAPLEFESPIQNQKTYTFETKEQNVHNAQKHSFKFEKNTLVFFPAYLRHRIGYHSSRIPRYSTAFNFHPIGKYGTVDSTIRESFIK